jgi:hypothetical protein
MKFNDNICADLQCKLRKDLALRFNEKVPYSTLKILNERLFNKLYITWSSVATKYSQKIRGQAK